MTGDDVRLARRGYEALASGDLERVLELVDPDVEIEVHTGRPDLPETQILRGHAGFLENLRLLTEVFEDIRVEPEEFFEVGDDLMVLIYTAGHGKASGIKVENRVVHIWTFRDGKATRLRVYASKEEALEAVGIEAPPPSSRGNP
jgi:ketosteroid isomerase-like protein